MSEPDYYQLLGVAPDAPVSEIRRAWRRRVRDVHPDAGGAPAEFHALQEAFGTLTDPQRRLEYDTERTGRRPAWLPQVRTGRHAKNRKVKEWKVDPRTPAPVPETRGDVLPRPWFADIKATRRVRTSPSALRHSVIAGLAVLAWLTAGLAAGTRAIAALDGPGGFVDAVIRTAVVPYLFVGLITAAVWSIRITPGVTWTSRVGPVASTFGAAIIAWVSRFSTGGWLLAVFTAGIGFMPLLARSLRAALRLRAATLAAIREFNAFGPAGPRPRADKHTGAILRELLTQLPAARLFVRVPVGSLRVEYTVTCGNRVALITHPQPRTPRDTGSENLSTVVGDVAELLGDVAVRGFVVWSHLPPDQPRTHGDVRHLIIPDATAEIGRWLAEQPYTLHLPTIRRLRDRLAAGPIIDSPTDHSGVKDTVGVR